MLVLQYIPYDLYGDFAPVFVRFFMRKGAFISCRMGREKSGFCEISGAIGSKKRLVFQAFRLKTQSSERGRTQDVKGGFLR